MVNDITESGMDFVSENTFQIEKSAAYKNSGKGIRSVEFVRVKEDKLLFVEAKTKFPNPNPDPNNPSEENGEEKLKRFQSEINNICDKFIHSLNLFSSVKVGVTEDTFPDDFVLPDRVSLVFVLVVKNHELNYCKPIKQKLMEILPSYLKKIWKPEVYVINHKTATKQELTKI